MPRLTHWLSAFSDVCAVSVRSLDTDLSIFMTDTSAQKRKKCCLDTPFQEKPLAIVTVLRRLLLFCRLFLAGLLILGNQLKKLFSYIDPSVKLIWFVCRLGNEWDRSSTFRNIRFLQPRQTRRVYNNSGCTILSSYDSSKWRKKWYTATLEKTILHIQLYIAIKCINRQNIW